MKTSLVLTCIGPDRPGLVESLSRVVADHDGNWVESRMAHLGGQFAGLLRVEVAPDDSAKLVEALESLGGGGFQITVTASDGEPARAERLVKLSLVGNDRPGIVRDISRVLAAHEVNVEELETSCTSAPESGEALFQAKARLHVPSSVSTDVLRDGLEEIANDLMVDVDLETSP